MEYKIKSIKHSGRKGERGTDRTDGRYPIRIGRTVDLHMKDITPGVPMWLNYLKDSNGNNYNGILRTSFVVDVHVAGDGCIVVETNNSVFEFEKV